MLKTSSHEVLIVCYFHPSSWCCLTPHCWSFLFLFHLLFPCLFTISFWLTFRLLIDETSNSREFVKLMHFIIWTFLESLAKTFVIKKSFLDYILIKTLLMWESFANLMHHSHGLIICNTHAVKSILDGMISCFPGCEFSSIGNLLPPYMITFSPAEDQWWLYPIVEKILRNIFGCLFQMFISKKHLRRPVIMLWLHLLIIS